MHFPPGCTAEQYKAVYHTVISWSHVLRNMKLACVGSTWPSLASCTWEEGGHTDFCRFCSHTSAWNCLGVHGGCFGWVFNSMSYCIFPSSEYTGDPWCSWCPVAVRPAGFCRKQGSSCSPPGVLACINQFFQAFILQFPQRPPVQP